MCSHYEAQWARIGHYSIPQWVKIKGKFLKKIMFKNKSLIKKYLKLQQKRKIDITKKRHFKVNN